MATIAGFFSEVYNRVRLGQSWSLTSRLCRTTIPILGGGGDFARAALPNAAVRAGQAGARRARSQSSMSPSTFAARRRHSAAMSRSSSRPKTGASYWSRSDLPTAFITLEPDVEVLYKTTAPYSAAHDRGVAWDDPDIGIAWPLAARRPGPVGQGSALAAAQGRAGSVRMMRIAVTGSKGQVATSLIERADREAEIVALGRPAFDLDRPRRRPRRT